MTRSETTKILAVLRAAWPNFYNGLSQDDAKNIVSLWQEMFADDDYQVVAAATKAIIVSGNREFPPTIGHIKAQMQKLMHPNEMTEAEAWNIVSRSLRNGLYGAEEEFNKMPPIIQRLVGSPNQLREWAMMDADTVQSVVASNFQRSFKIRSATEKEYLALPSDVKQVVSKLTAGMQMDALPEAAT